MIAVIFEVFPGPGREEDYFRIASELRSELEQIEGFISVERFRSLIDPAKFLSLSFWRDEEAIQKWRNAPCHRRAQADGRREIFADYRLRVASVIRDYGMDERGGAPADSSALPFTASP